MRKLTNFQSLRHETRYIFAVSPFNICMRHNILTFITLTLTLKYLSVSNIIQKDSKFRNYRLKMNQAGAGLCLVKSQLLLRFPQDKIH